MLLLIFEMMRLKSQATPPQLLRGMIVVSLLLPLLQTLRWAKRVAQSPHGKTIRSRHDEIAFDGVIVFLAIIFLPSHSLSSAE